jgi:hypothetical protein
MDGIIHLQGMQVSFQGDNRIWNEGSGWPGLLSPWIHNICSAYGFLCLVTALGSFAHASEVHWRITENDDTKPLPCRIHLMDADHRPVEAPDLPFWKDHFVTPGDVQLELNAGRYQFRVHRGPEYAVLEGTFTVQSKAAPLKLHHSLKRLAHLSEEGWWSGELHIHRPLADVPLLMKAEDLHVGPVITWWNKNDPWKNRPPPKMLWQEAAPDRLFYAMGGEDERRGGALLFFKLHRPLPIQAAGPEYPSSIVYLEAAAEQGAWIDIEKPFWWDVPAWIASGKADSIGLANNHMLHSGMLDNEAWGRPRPAAEFPSPRGNGQWTQYLYYQILNAGIPLAPSAGSASGVLNNPVGYNRVYVYLNSGFELNAWWDGLREGRSFVTNGPLLRCQAGDFLPGSRIPVHVAGKAVHLKARLSTEDPVEAFEIIHNGILLRRIPVRDHTGQTLQDLGPAPLETPGWFLVRAISSVKHTFRFASTAPFYVVDRSGNIPTNRKACRFFLDWTRERMQALDLKDPRQRSELMRDWKKTEAFWKDKLEKTSF